MADLGLLTLVSGPPRVEVAAESVRVGRYSFRSVVQQESLAHRGPERRAIAGPFFFGLRLLEVLIATFTYMRTWPLGKLLLRFGSLLTWTFVAVTLAFAISSCITLGAL